MAQNRNNSARKTQPGHLGSSMWIIIAVIAVLFVVGLLLRSTFVPTRSSSSQNGSAQIRPANASWDSSLDSQGVLQVASRFKCACGGCGELPLDECRCDMPGGAKEEKTFIRDELLAGLSVDQVADLVEKKYGLRVN